MPSVTALIVATMVAWTLSDALKPLGPPSLAAMSSMLVWTFVFSMVRRLLLDLRPSL
jgi:hypothetical protein